VLSAIWKKPTVNLTAFVSLPLQIIRMTTLALTRHERSEWSGAATSGTARYP
jgi:hypothetical protein